KEKDGSGGGSRSNSRFDDRREYKPSGGSKQRDFSERKPNYANSEKQYEKGGFKKRERKPVSSFQDNTSISDKNRAVKDFETFGQFKKKTSKKSTSFEPKYKEDLLW